LVDFDYMRTLQKKERNVTSPAEVPEDFYADLAAFVRSAAGRSKGDAAEARILENTIKLSREVFEKREQKLLTRALLAVRTSESGQANLTPEEKAVLDELAAVLKRHRQFFDQVILGEYEKPAQPERTLINPSEPNVLVRARQPIPRFVGEDALEYGPFDANDVVKLPRREAELLSSQSLVELM
jgi:DNA replication initiation complex subunit (GINS family)